MATFTDRGLIANASIYGNDCAVPAFTPAAGSLLLLFYTGLNQTPSAVTGHGTWAQIGTTINFSGTYGSAWGCIVGETPTSSAVTASLCGNYSTVIVVEVAGVDTSGTVANAITQTKTAAGYINTTLSLTFDTLPTEDTLLWTAKNGNTGTVVSVGDTTLNSDNASVGGTAKVSGVGYDSPSSASIDAVFTGGSNGTVGIAYEFKAAATGVSLTAPDTVTHGVATTATGALLSTVNVTTGMTLEYGTVAIAQTATYVDPDLNFTPDVGVPTLYGTVNAVASLPLTPDSASAGTTAYQVTLEITDG